MGRQVLAAAVGVAAAACGTMTCAATITVTLGPWTVYDNTTDFTPLPPLQQDVPGFFKLYRGAAYEIPVYFELGGLAAGQSFGDIAFDAIPGGSFVRDPLGYAGSGASYPSGKSPVLYYQWNADAGASSMDLKSIVAYFPAGPASPQRAAAGVGSPFLIGYLYLDIPSTAKQVPSLDTVVWEYSLNDNGALVMQPNNTIVQPAAITLIPEIIFVDVPEPAGLFCVGIMAGAMRRGRRAHSR